MKRSLILLVILMGLVMACGQSTPAVAPAYIGKVVQQAGPILSLRLESVTEDKDQNLTGLLSLENYPLHAFDGDISLEHHTIFLTCNVPGFGWIDLRGTVKEDGTWGGSVFYGLDGSPSADIWTLSPA